MAKHFIPYCKVWLLFWIAICPSIKIFTIHHIQKNTWGYSIQLCRQVSQEKHNDSNDSRSPFKSINSLQREIITMNIIYHHHQQHTTHDKKISKDPFTLHNHHHLHFSKVKPLPKAVYTFTQIYSHHQFLFYLV